MKKILIGAIVILGGVLLLGSCGTENENKIVVGSKPMTEQNILSEMICLIIEENTDEKVDRKFNVSGGVANLDPGIRKGEIDVYPEYSGTSWLVVYKESPIENSQVYNEVQKKYEKDGLTYGDTFGFNNTYRLGVTREFAKKYNLKTMSDLKKVEEEVVLVGEFDFFEREDGYSNMAQAYNLNIGKKVPVDINLKYQSISSNNGNVVVTFSTDSQIKANGLVVLEDDKEYFGIYEAGPVFSKDFEKKHKEAKKEIDKLRGIISNEDIINMNYEVEVNKRRYEDVAREYLEKKGLI